MNGLILLKFVAKRGRCTSIWQFCGLISVPWELSSQSLAGLALDLKLAMLNGIKQTLKLGQDW